MAYGSPERLADVPAYYADIRGGRPIRPELMDDLVERYRRLGVEDGSPLNAITEATRAALEARARPPGLHRDEALDPRIAAAAEQALAAGAEDVVGLVLAPHYSELSIAGYRRLLEPPLAGRAGSASSSAGTTTRASSNSSPTRCAATRRTSSSPRTACPARILDHGDPYEAQLHETSRLVAERAGLGDWSFSYQSASPTGEPWLGPDILDHLASLREPGIEDVLVCPVGFVSDHLEIRWDLDIEAAERAAPARAAASRGSRCRTPSPRSSPASPRSSAGALAALRRSGAC